MSAEIRKDVPLPMAELRALARAHGWKSKSIRINLGDAISIHRLGLPGVEIVASEDARRGSFHARLLVCKRERGSYNDQKDLQPLLENPDLIGPRCRIGQCSRPSKDEAALCSFHQSAIEQEQEA